LPNSVSSSISHLLTAKEKDVIQSSQEPQVQSIKWRGMEFGIKDKGFPTPHMQMSREMSNGI
jgi:hypothetical protein